VLQPGRPLLQPFALSQPEGHDTKPGGSGQPAWAPHTTSGAQEAAALMPPRQLPSA